MWTEFLLALCFVLMLLFGGTAWLLFRTFKVIKWIDSPIEPAGEPIKLSVIIPARNEEEDLDKALRSVLSQRGVEFEVILVNDHSTDRTGPIADTLAQSDSRLRVVHNPPLPPGWLGKLNAVQQ